jgi:hypothetical protein
MSASGRQFPYVVVLKNTTDRAFSMLAVLLNLASAVFFFKEFLLTGQVYVARTIGLAVLIGILVYNYFQARQGKKVLYNRAYIVTALLWVTMPYMQWLIFPFAALAILEHQVKSPLEIGFSESQVVLNSLFKKKYHWSQLSNVVLKDGLLTMDFINNRILQREVEEDDEEDDASEEEFNQFCREQLKKNPAGLYGNLR